MKVYDSGVVDQLLDELSAALAECSARRSIMEVYGLSIPSTFQSAEST